MFCIFGLCNLWTGYTKYIQLDLKYSHVTAIYLILQIKKQCLQISSCNYASCLILMGFEYLSCKQACLRLIIQNNLEELMLISTQLQMGANLINPLQGDRKKRSSGCRERTQMFLECSHKPTNIHHRPNRQSTVWLSKLELSEQRRVLKRLQCKSFLTIMTVKWLNSILAPKTHQ